MPAEEEKPESVHVQGLCPKRTSKRARLSRPRPEVKCVSCALPVRLCDSLHSFVVSFNDGLGANRLCCRP
jgi:hypothetical protein